LREALVKGPKPMNPALIILGFGLILLGVLLIILAAFLGRARARGGGLILIGPIPIIFGDRSLGTILLIITLLILIPIILFMFMVTAG
jgi:uncharacterized membrane protein